MSPGSKASAKQQQLAPKATCWDHRLVAGAGATNWWHLLTLPHVLLG